MGLIRDLIPLNLDTEKKKFFKLHGNYNPQFVYVRQFTDKVLQKYGLPNEESFKKAEIYLQDSSFRKDEVETPISEEEIRQEVLMLCYELKIPEIEVKFNFDQGGNFMLTADNELRVKLPITFSLESLRSSLNHEIQTHLLRKMNNRIQPWSSEIRPKKNWIRTEEGLALYNANFGMKEPDLGRAALLYVLVEKAREEDFKSLFKIAMTFFNDEDKSFSYAYRAKRGLNDTSLGGGFTKDIVYWEGYWLVEEWLQKNSMRDLYWGRIDVSEVENLRGEAKTEGLVYPTFINQPD